MALPRLNESPQYELVIPSTGTTVNYRPFLVKEQKVLLIAYESQDQKQIITSILNCISGCTDNKIDVSKLSTFDTDYIFTKIRSKSVGENINVNAKCKTCEEKTEVKINLDNIELMGNIKPSTVNITDEITLKMRYPSYNDFVTNEKIMKNSVTTETIFEMLICCIESVMTEEENIVLKDEPREEVERFINSLTNAQFQKLQEFVDEIPKITLDVDFVCASCNNNNKTKLEGLQDFFS
jgi:hypothetical protein